MGDKPITTDEASRRLEIDRARGRALAIAAGIAIPWGGGKKRTHLRVMFDQFEEVVLGQRYSKVRQTVKNKPRSTPMKLNPDVTC